jgi:cytochrome c oxidase cbb3-type subunit III
MKKYIKFIAPAMLLLLAAMPAMAQSLGNPNEPYTFSSLVSSLGDTLLYIILSISLLMLFLVTVIYFSVMRLRDKILAETHPEYEAKSQQSLWARVFEVSPTSADKDVMLDHSYDNIVELNNPIPRWFMVLFYSTVVFAVVYLLNYHVFKSSKLQLAEYETEVEQAQIAYQAYLKEAGDKINPETVTLLTDKDEVEKGKEMFLRPGSCYSCHGKNGEGNIGPNLTDEYWIHGGGIKNVFKTISEGAPNTTMVSWKKKFSPLEIQQIASYVISLEGSKPDKAKEPQGEKWLDGATAPADTTGKDTLATTTLTSMR